MLRLRAMNIDVLSRTRAGRYDNEESAAGGLGSERWIDLLHSRMPFRCRSGSTIRRPRPQHLHL